MNIKNSIDISWPITADMTTYKDSKIVELRNDKDFEKDYVRSSTISLDSHTGTHVDAPSHFTKGGKTIDQVPLESLVGKCRVLDVTDVEKKITAIDLEKHNIQKNEILLLKTKNSALSPTQKFEYNFIYLEQSGAQFLADKKIKTVGIDYLGIERKQPDHETHVILFEHGITIIEGIRLQQVEAKEYFLLCLPINIQGLEAAPARALLIEK